jgi:PLP dependent protein
MTDSPATVRPDRRAELATGLARVRSRIAGACAAAGRDDSEVTMIAVTKTYPAGDVVALAGLGVADVGENRDQEASTKAAEVTAAGATPRWHFIGQLQRNKAAAVARLGAVVHSVDRDSLARVLDRVGRERGRPVEVFVQGDLGGPEGDLAARGGRPPDDVPALADLVAASAGLALRGLMAVAPRDTDPRPAFDRLAALAARVRADHPEAVDVSAGMSGDLEAAIAAGATLVRVGTALFGDRPLPFAKIREHQPPESHQ